MNSTPREAAAATAVATAAVIENPAAPIVVAAESVELSESSSSIVGDLMMLTKARLSALVLVTTFVGFCTGSGESIDWFLLFRVCFGTAFVAASASVLNQVIERKVDRLMARTKDRPLPAGRMQITTALGLGVLLGVAGFIYLFLRVSHLAALLAALTLGVYVLLYTPLKRRTSWCVTVGAISGAIPPMIGWSAAHGSLGVGAWILFGVLFFWQMPHFLAIAWMYRDEYAQAGFVMLRRNDISGMKAALESLLAALALAVVTLLPFFLKTASPVYFVGALACDALLIFCAVQFLILRNRPSARRLFFASILYLPLLLGLLTLARQAS